LERRQLQSDSSVDEVDEEEQKEAAATGVISEKEEKNISEGYPTDQPTQQGEEKASARKETHLAHLPDLSVDSLETLSAQLTATTAPRRPIDKETGLPYMNRQAAEALSVATRAFLEDARRVHRGRGLDFGEAQYRGPFEEVEVVCRRHGPFWITPDDLLGKRRGCPECDVGGRRGKPKRAKNTEE